MNNNPLELVIITGLSGAGKSTAMHFFEDFGYFCMDNVPPALLPKFIQICQESNGSISKIAVVIDARGGAFFETLFEAIEKMKILGAQIRILYLEAKKDVLIRRFSETRRKHPLNKGGTVVEDIKTEIKLLEPTRPKADIVIDSSNTNTRELQEAIRKAVEDASNTQTMSVVFMSFGFKHGVPLDCDLVFDVRFIPNPYYIPELKNLTGLDKEVSDYVLSSENGKAFAEKLESFINFMIPCFISEPKTRLQVGIGCTGGRHRSVTFAEYLFKKIKHERIRVSRRHRDLDLK
jgi:UPF0042 nucleotide-binding protein